MNQLILNLYLILSTVITAHAHNSTCVYCQTQACHCSTEKSLLNCSSYLLPLPFAPSCADTKLWQIVDFSLRNLESLDSTKLLALRMAHLILKSNLITYIDEHTFDSLADTLIELDLEMNQLSKWFNSKLLQLKILNLPSNQLETFGNSNEMEFPSLQQLNLSRNLIDTFPNQVHRWTSLTTLDLSFNKLTSIPRFALMGLNNLTWLSFASNLNLNCIIQDSFKYLKSLKYLDLSSTNLFDLDPCIFIPLIGLKIFRIERVPLNCTSCWVVIARKQASEISGRCLANRTVRSFDSLSDHELQYACSTSSIDCSTNYCEPGSLNSDQRSSALTKLTPRTGHTLEILLGVMAALIVLIILLVSTISISRWKQGKKFFCCPIPQTTNVEAVRRRRQHHKQIIDNNPAVIESVVTHGANMNVPPYPHQNYGYFNDETSNNKRKLYNPMFADSPTADVRRQQQQQQSSMIVSNDSEFCSENL